MELEVYESRKGTKVVTAGNLYLSLGLPNHQYGTNVRRWLRDAYDFREGIRRPEVMRDYARRPSAELPLDDFYLTLELAKQICLRSNSREKIKIARYLDAKMHNGQMDLFLSAAA